MIGAFGMGADKSVNLGIGLQRNAGLNFVFYKRPKGLLREDLSREANTAAEIYPIFFGRHIVKGNFWAVFWLG